MPNRLRHALHACCLRNRYSRQETETGASNRTFGELQTYNFTASAKRFYIVLQLCKEFCAWRLFR